MNEKQKIVQHKYIDLLMKYYEEERVCIGQSQHYGVLDNKMQVLRHVLQEATDCLARTFYGPITTWRRGLLGKLDVFIKRAYRKATRFIFHPYQAKTLETLNQVVEVLNEISPQNSYENLTKILENIASTRVAAMHQIKESENTLMNLNSEVGLNIKQLMTLNSNTHLSMEQLLALNSSVHLNMNELLALNNDVHLNMNNQLAMKNEINSNTNHLQNLNHEISMKMNQLSTVNHEATSNMNQLLSLNHEVHLNMNKLLSLDNEISLKLNHLNFVEEATDTRHRLITENLDLKLKEMNYIRSSVVDMGHEIKHSKALPQETESIECFIEECGFMSYSQCGEDGIVLYLLQMTGKSNPYDVRYLDIGCNDYRKDSNTFYFYKAGASGVLIDANPRFSEMAKLKRPRDTALNVGVGSTDSAEMKFYVLNNNGLSSFSREKVEEVLRSAPSWHISEEILVPVRCINEILAEHFSDESPDILSVDVEGMDYELLEAIDYSRFRPRIIIVETIHYEPRLVVGGRNSAFADLMKEKKYAEFAFTGINSIFIDETRL